MCIVHTGANRPDFEALPRLLDELKGVPTARRGRPKKKFAALYADKGYAFAPCYALLEAKRIKCRIIGAKMPDGADWPKVRAAVERTFSWFNGQKKLLIRYERSMLSWSALHRVATILICWRQLGLATST